jgi:protein TonB
MSRAHVPAVSRAAGFALLAPVNKPQLDPARIATMSGTLALNLLAFGLLMLPLALPPPVIDLPHEPRMVARDIPPEVVVPVEIVKAKQPVTPPRPVAPPLALRPPALPANTDAVRSQTGSEPLTDPGPVDTDPIAAGPVDIGPANSGPAAIQLQYRHAPAPDYPRNAQRRGWTGSVLLQVLVGIDGRPLEVSIARSSGHRELDEAARAQVLKRWRFQPAMQGDRPVQALGLVPIEFTLPR